MKRHRHRIQVGLFVTVSFFALAGLIMWLAGSRFLRPVDSYHIIFDKSVTGLLPGARVEYQGVTVGKVSRLGLTQELPPRPIVTIDLKPGTAVRKDTYAYLFGSLVTNIRYVELAGGSAAAEPLPEGGVIPSQEKGIEGIQDRASQISEEILKVIEQLKREVLTKENLAAVGVAFRNLSAVTGNVRAALDEVSTPATRTMLVTTIENISQAAAGIRRATLVVDEVKADAKAALSNLRKTAESTERLARQAELLAQHMDQMVSQNQNEMTRLLSSMTETAQSLREVSSVIRDDPSRLIWGNTLPIREIPDK